jgi:ABC-2 type transport system ATP-binding protein
MRSGRLVFQGPLAELRRTGTTRIRVQTAEPARAADVLRRLRLTGPLIAGNEVSAQLAGHQPERICAELLAAGVGVRGLSVITPSLEELFVALTG